MRINNSLILKFIIIIGLPGFISFGIFSSSRDFDVLDEKSNGKAERIGEGTFLDSSGVFLTEDCTPPVGPTPLELPCSTRVRIEIKPSDITFDMLLLDINLVPPLFDDTLCDFATAEHDTYCTNDVIYPIHCKFGDIFERGPFPAGTKLYFAIFSRAPTFPPHICDLRYPVIEKVGHYKIKFENWTDNDCDDIILKVSLLDDVTPPVITCPPDTTLFVDINCQATYNGPPATATDDCDTDPTIFSIPPLPALFDGPGSYIITWIATDAGGNADTCLQTITVVDPASCCEKGEEGIFGDWTIEFVDVTTKGPYNAIALWHSPLASSFPWISYWRDEGDTTGLWHAWKDPDSTCRINPDVNDWSLYPLDIWHEGRGAWSSIAIQQMDDPDFARIHISYTDTVPGERMAFYYGRSRCTIDARHDIVDNVGDLGTYGTDIAVAPDSTVCMVYYDATNGALKYAERLIIDDPFSWVNITVDNGGGNDVGRYPAIAIDSDGIRHVSYYDATNGNLMYAQCDPAFGPCYDPPGPPGSDGWILPFAVVDAGGDVGLFTEIAVDNSGAPHISYVDATNQSLKYAFFFFSWIPVPVEDSPNDLIASTSIGIGIDPTSGDITRHISYSDRTLRTLKYATCSDNPPACQTTLEWNPGIETVPDPWSDVGLWNSIAVDLNDKPHISYSTVDSLCDFKALKYTTRQ